jgi:ProP effector
MTPSVPEETPAAPAAPAAAPSSPASTQRPRGARPRGRKPPSAQAARAPHPLLDRLAEFYPHLFGAQFRPLKIGVFQDLVARHPDDLPKDELKVALGFHTRSTRYLESVAAGQARHDLEGAETEPLAPEHVHHAIMEVFRRRQARSRENLKPWLLDRLVAAIDASGLSQGEYLERIHTSEPFALEALDRAFAEIAERAAKREALQRAYQASGRSVEEFAEMYGLDVATVQAAVL